MDSPNGSDRPVALWDRVMGRSAPGAGGALRCVLLTMLLAGCSDNPGATRVASLAIPHAEAIQDMAVWGNTAVLALRQNDGPEVVAVDVGDPAHPRLAWSFEVGADVNGIDIPVAGDVALLATSADAAELLLFDLTARRVVGTFDAPGTSDGIFVDYANLGSERAWLSTADNPDETESYSLDVHDPTHPTVLGRNEAIAPLARPLPPDPAAKGYAAGGTVVARGRGLADPALTLLAVRSPTDAFQVVRGLDDHVTVPDVNGDGVRLVACIGDSNTLIVMNKNPGSWCHYLQQHVWYPKIAFVDWAWMGATMTPPHSTPLEEQLRQAMAWKADLIITAFGTNDVTYHEPEEILAAAKTLTDDITRAGVPFMIATPPPRFDVPKRSARIDEFSALLRKAYPADRVIDFRAGMTASDISGDGFHVSAQGAVTEGRIAEKMLVAP